MERFELNLNDKKVQEDVLQITSGLVIGEDAAARIKAIFEEELSKGMQDGLSASSLQMENTFVPELINGQENGDYLALDLGGTNFRVMLLKLRSGKIVDEVVSYYTVPDATRLGPGVELFDFLAGCIKDFVDRAKDKLDNGQSRGGRRLPLGFTFSFPMTQEALDKGILVSWTKSFNCSGAVGKDAAQMLKDAIGRCPDLPVEVVAILNDSTGTLVMGSYDDPDCCIGLILGTGCNGAYFERAENVVRWGGDPSRRGQGNSVHHVIIDPEFGAFGDNGCIDFIKTEFDRSVDAESLLPASFTFEKYFAGKYIGEILRKVLQKLHGMGCFLRGRSEPGGPNGLQAKDSLSSTDVSDIVADALAGTLDKTDAIFRKLDGFATMPAMGSDDLEVVRYVCSILTERCGLLVAIPLAVFLERMRKPGKSTVGVTGSLYKHHPKVKSVLDKYIRKFTEGKIDFATFLCDDGSGKGAGLVAAIADRLNLN